MYYDNTRHPFDTRDADTHNAPFESKDRQKQFDFNKNRPQNTFDDDVFRRNYYEAFGEMRPQRKSIDWSVKALVWAKQYGGWILLFVLILVWFKGWMPFVASTKMLEKDNTEIKNPNAFTPTKNEEHTPLSILGIGEGEKKAALSELDEDAKISYMKRFAQIAVTERQKFGVPSSIILAMGLLQSRAGTNDYATRSNNHFALPCTMEWSGASDNYNGSCLRHYENAWLSFRNFSVTMTSGKFTQLQKLGNKNYKGWAKGLEEMGYPSANPHLANALIEIIEKYKLNEQLDNR